MYNKAEISLKNRKSDKTRKIRWFGKVTQGHYSLEMVPFDTPHPVNFYSNYVPIISETQ